MNGSMDQCPSRLPRLILSSPARRTQIRTVISLEPGEPVSS